MSLIEKIFPGSLWLAAVSLFSTLNFPRIMASSLVNSSFFFGEFHASYHCASFIQEVMQRNNTIDVQNVHHQ
jgi:hypothetical protein